MFDKKKAIEELLHKAAKANDLAVKNGCADVNAGPMKVANQLLDLAVETEVLPDHSAMQRLEANGYLRLGGLGAVSKRG